MSQTASKPNQRKYYKVKDDKYSPECLNLTISGNVDIKSIVDEYCHGKTKLRIEFKRFKSPDLSSLVGVSIENIELRSSIATEIDLSPLEDMHGPRNIGIRFEMITDIDLSPLGNISTLDNISILGCTSLENIGLHNLKYSNISGIHLKIRSGTIDLSPLDGMKSLKSLVIFGDIKSLDLSPLQNCNSLSSISVYPTEKYPTLYIDASPIITIGKVPRLHDTKNSPTYEVPVFFKYCKDIGIYAYMFEYNLSPIRLDKCVERYGLLRTTEMLLFAYKHLEPKYKYKIDKIYKNLLEILSKSNDEPVINSINDNIHKIDMIIDTLSGPKQYCMEPKFSQYTHAFLSRFVPTLEKEDTLVETVNYYYRGIGYTIYAFKHAPHDYWAYAHPSDTISDTIKEIEDIDTLRFHYTYKLHPLLKHEDRKYTGVYYSNKIDAIDRAIECTTEIIDWLLDDAINETENTNKITVELIGNLKTK